MDVLVLRVVEGRKLKRRFGIKVWVCKVCETGALWLVGELRARIVGAVGVLLTVYFAART